MPLAYQEVPARLKQRCCLVCGYDGPELQGELHDGAYRCPACDADLYARPPRSYAELEGFVLGEGAGDGASSKASGSVEIKVRRSFPLWLAGLLARLRRPARRD
jgi:hypothetical protein